MLDLSPEFLISLESEIRGAKARKRDRCAFINRSTGAETAFGDTTNIGVVTACRGDKLDDVNAREGDCFCSGNSCPGGPRTGTDTGTRSEEGHQDYLAGAFGLRNRLSWRNGYYG